MPSRLIAVVAVTFGITVAALTAPAAAAPRTAIDRVLPEMKFTGVTLGDALDFVRDVSGLNIHVNWKALEEQNVTADTPVNIRLRAVSVRKLLNLLLSEAGGGDTLTYYVDEGVIEITTREMADKKVYTRVYPVEDLVMEIPEFNDAPNFNLQSTAQQGSQGGGGGGGGSGSSIFGNGSSDRSNRDDPTTTTREQRGEQLVELIMETVRPEIWAANGGIATIRYFRGSLVVTAPRSVHEALGH